MIKAICYPQNESMKDNCFQSHHINQRWSSNSYSTLQFDDYDITPTTIITKQRRITFSSISINDRCHNMNSPDKPIRCPLRRNSIDSNTSSSISTTSSISCSRKRSKRNIIINNDCTNITITLPTYISFESNHDDIIDNNVTSSQEDSNNKMIMPPKYPRRTSMDVVFVSDNVIISSHIKPIMSTLKPIRNCSYKNSNNRRNRNQNNNKNHINDDEIQAIKNMISTMDNILCNNNNSNKSIKGIP